MAKYATNSKSLSIQLTPYSVSKQGGIKSTLLAAFCAACVLAQLGVCLAQYISFRRIQFYSELTHELAIQRAVSAVTAFTDVTIACVLAYLLHMNRSGLRRMDSVINRLILYSFGSGLATGVLAIIALILTLASPTTFVYLLVDLLVPKCEQSPSLTAPPTDGRRCNAQYMSTPCLLCSLCHVIACYGVY